MKQNKIFLQLLVLCLVLFFLVSCGGKKISRIDVNEETNVSGRWNDTDSKLVAQEMIKDVLSRPWLSQFNKKSSRKPRVIIQKVLNKSHEHIQTQTFIQDLERELLNSGLISFVAGKLERKQLREERKEQIKNSGPSGRKFIAEKNPDFILQGTISSIIDQKKGEKVVFYQTNLKLININTNEKVWIGQKKIKKIISRSRFSF